MAHARIRRSPPWPLRLVLVVLSTLIGLALVEVTFRLAKLKRLTIPAGIDHPHFHHRLNSNQDYRFNSGEFDVTIHTNRYGLRGLDPVIPKPAGVLRILMLGDSFTFGFPVKDDEAFASRIEQGLKEQGYPVEVINGGVSGYSPTLHYLSLRDEFLRFEPDLVMLWYDLGDLQEDAWFQKNLLYDADGRILRADPAYINGQFSRWEWLRNHSVFAKYLDTKLVRTFNAIRILGFGEFVRTKLRGERAKVAIARLKASQQSEDLATYDRFLLVRPSSTPEMLSPYWALSAGYLDRIRGLLAERRIPFVLGMYPYGMFVGPDQWGDGRVYWGFEKGRTYDASVARGLFKQFAKERDVLLLDTFKSFQAAATEPLFYNRDGHMTPAGHRVLAAHVLEDPSFQRLMSRLTRQSR